MTEQTDITVHDCLKAAWEALLRGDTEERDRLCNLAKMGMGEAPMVLLNKSIFETEGEAQ